MPYYLRLAAIRATLAFCLMLASITLLDSCAGLPSAREAGLRFSTQAADIPPGIEWAVREEAFELINSWDPLVVLSGGTAPISAESWADFKPPRPWLKNIERHILFSGSYFLRSPSAPEKVSGRDGIIWWEIAGYSWIELARPLAVDFVPAGKKTDISHPAPGMLVLKAIKKPQILRFSGSFYRLSDPLGNLYAMHACEAPEPSLNVVLPPGWVLEKVALEEDLLIPPVGGANGSYHVILGDSLGQGYHQYRFVSESYPPPKPPRAQPKAATKPLEADAGAEVDVGADARADVGAEAEAVRENSAEAGVESGDEDKK